MKTTPSKRALKKTLAVTTLAVVLPPPSIARPPSKRFQEYISRMSLNRPTVEQVLAAKPCPRVERAAKKATAAMAARKVTAAARQE